MIFALWDRISYIVQLVAACGIFMVNVRKRPCFVWRLAGCTLALIVLAYVFGSVVAIPSGTVWEVLYWAAFGVVCVPMVMLCMEGSLAEAIYCTICANAMQHAAYECYMVYHMLAGSLDSAPLDGIITTLIYASVYAAFYVMFARKLPSNGRYRISRNDLFPMACILLFIWVLSILEHDVSTMRDVIYHISDALCCYYIMWAQLNGHAKMRLQEELDGVKYTLMQQEKQYRLTQETIDIINRKCHDLKHQIRALREMRESPERDEYFNEAEQAIMIYDTAVKTGNRALDIVLMEKGLFCQSHGIQLTCMADGTALDFMRMEDIYALFGNAMDNAIRAVSELKDPAKRVINVIIRGQGDLVMIQVQNYHQGRLRFRAGLPVTTQRDKARHGFGMKSMLHTAEQYGGTLSVSDDAGIFSLQVLLPKR
ncbi:ATP-binding protein [Bifidobacterium miconisargentati]|uniref:ATP-binding protein n=1 Tax=Bifidobacterium miconisargentati TaxID=2834437 RepID=UPI001BDCAF1A|nr:ATP-binding protein [Bifidobacterium miconisargentati]MBW3089483.1 sensor histidine kinase [Bifidobacterium miconisargentati]